MEGGTKKVVGQKTTFCLPEGVSHVGPGGSAEPVSPAQTIWVQVDADCIAKPWLNHTG